MNRRTMSTKPKGAKDGVKKWTGEDTDYISGDLVHIYTNNARINFNNWDATILFGEILGNTTDKLVVLPKARVTMSLQFVKELRDLLDRNIKVFEEKVGEIQTLRLDGEEEEEEVG